MFEVDPNLWLQSFAFPALTWLMLGISRLGYDWFYILLVVVLGFGVRLRPTLGVLLALLLSGVATHAAKGGFELPRPSDVDARVLYRGEVHRPLAVDGGAATFFALPSPQARAALRATPAPNYGFISGHVAGATAMCLALLLCFRIRSRAAWIALCAWPLLMGISRMYLGRHFLGDVCGGLVAGVIAALAAAWLVRPRGDAMLQPARLQLLAAGTLLACAFAPGIPLLDQQTLGRLAGVVVVMGVLSWRGFPVDEGTPWQRIARVACVCVAYVLIHAATRWLGDAAGWGKVDPVWLPVGAVATAAMFLVGFATWRGLGLFRQPEHS
jgi:membrane-associated phospholipid phosphatase